MTSATPHLVDVSWLRAHALDADLVLADVRWNMGEPSGRERYRQGHLPGAHFVDLDADLSRPAYDGPGRHPLPSVEHFARVLSRVGLSAQSTMVCYDDRGGAIAARLWWMCRAVGVPARVCVLSGGLQSWERAGGELSQHVPEPVNAPLMALSEAFSGVVSKTQVSAALRDGALVLDARGGNRYRGELEPVDARPGHIPGAVSAPYVANLVEPGGRLRDLETLRAHYEALGALDREQVIVSCGSGVTACHDIWALAMLGRTDAMLYEGSWSDWSRDPELAVAVGPEPGG